MARTVLGVQMARTVLGVLLLTLLVVYVAADGPDPCPPCWTYFEASEKCYRHLSSLQRLSITYEESKQECRFLQGVLAMPTTTEINAGIRDLIAANGGGWPWFGIEHSGNNGLRWVNGDKISWTNWGSGQPDDTVKCVSMSPDNGKWASADCSSKRGCVCEMDPIYENCPPKWTHFKSSDTCYREINIAREVYKRAKWLCEYQCGTLAMPRTNQINEELRNIMYPGWPWIGIDVDRDNRRFKWANGDLLSWSNSGFNFDNQCVAMSSSTGEWGGADCNSKRAYVCELEPIYQQEGRHWLVKVNTAREKQAGTKDARASIKLIGDVEISNWIHLDNKHGGWDFPKGSTKKFFISTEIDIGKLETIELRYKSWGWWKLNYIDVTDVRTERTETFEFDNWLKEPNTIVLAPRFDLE